MTTDAASGTEAAATATTTVVATPAPNAAAPAAPVTPTPNAAADSGEPTPHVYAEVPNDPGLNMALGFIGKLGVTPEHPALQEALKGNFDYLKAHLASLGDKARGYEHYLALAEKSYEAHVSVAAETAAKTAEAIHGAVGGEEAWQSIQQWASANAEPAEKEAVNAMINAGGLQARAAALLLQSLHAKASNTVIEPKDAVGHVPANSASTAQHALSPAAYQAEMSKLVQQYGALGAGKTPEYQALQSRRTAYRGQ